MPSTTLPLVTCSREEPTSNRSTTTHASSGALVALPQQNQPGPLTIRSLAARRADRAAHTHATVWTKDPHGGPHAPADAGGVRAATERADADAHAARLGTEAVAGPRPLPGSGPHAATALPLGYARPAPPGPTTNFVGDAMVGTAAQLVGARLAAANAAAAAAAVAGRPPLAGPVHLLRLEEEGGGDARPPASVTLVPIPCSPADLRAQALALVAAVEGWGVPPEAVGQLEG